MSEEIESRYLVPDRPIFDHLCRVRRLGEMRVAHRRTQRLRDVYLDTPGRALLRQGWASRVRRSRGSCIVTLKGPRHGQGAVWERAQFEVSLAQPSLRVEEWPAGDVRTRIQELTGGSALSELVRLRQVRHCAELWDDDRLVGELSLDVVNMAGKGLEHTSLMLEAELAESGTSEDLDVLDDTLINVYGLVPEPRSKLQRALALVETSEQLDTDLWQRVQPATPQVIATRYGVDPKRAALAEAFAMRLCDILGSASGISERGRLLLSAAAWLHEIGRETDPDNPQIAGRDLILRQQLAGLTETETEIVALAVLLHRGKITPESIDTSLTAEWPAAVRSEALSIAALLRIAVTLSRRLPEPEGILETRQVSGGLRVVLYVPGQDAQIARRAARRATRRSDLWGIVSDVRLEWASITPSEDGEALTLARPANILGLNRWDGMPVAAHKILAFYYQRMLDHEAGTRLGEDIEELHAMRVATRRLRSALRLMGPYLGTPLTDPVNDSLRRLARVLGNVRDMDVALLKMDAYRETLTAEDGQHLKPLRRVWQRRRDQAHSSMMRYLDSRAYTRLHERMTALLEALQRQERQVSDHEQVGFIAPRMVYLYWQATRAYSAVLRNAPAELLHLLRIDCKRLRFALEFFADVLPSDVAALVDEVVGVQDHLGTMRDEIVAIEMIDVYLAHPRTRRTRQAAMDYRACCDASRAQLLETFPQAWSRLDHGSMSQVVEAMVQPED